MDDDDADIHFLCGGSAKVGPSMKGLVRDKSTCSMCFLKYYGTQGN